MKTLFSILVVTILSFSLVLGQSTREEAKKLQKPKDSGITDYDAFKNSSFGLLSELIKTDENYEKTKANVSGYLEGGQEYSVDQVKTDIGEFKKLKKSLENMDERVISLTKEGNDLLQNASNVKPVTKVKAATSNTKKALQAVDLSKSMISEITEGVVGDITKLSSLIGEEEE